MLWSNEDIAKLREMLVKHPSRSVIEITRMMALGYNVDDVSGVCAALLSKGDSDMGEKRIDVEEFWQLVDERKELKEIAKHFGVSIQSVHKRISKGRPKAAPAANENKKENEDMKKFDWTPERLEKLLEMGEDAYSPQKIAETLGCDAKTVSNKLYGLKIANGGKIPPSRKRRYAVADVTPYKPEDVDDLEETPADEPIETPTETIDTPTEIADNSEESKKSTIIENPTAGMPKPIDIVDLAYKAKYMACDVGFNPDHLMVNMDPVRNDIIVTGKGEDGKVYEIQLSVTDPTKLEAAI